MNVLGKLRHYIPYDGKVSVRVERWRRAARRMRHFGALRSSKYPWNAAAHSLRWSLASERSIETWTNDRLQLAPHFWLFIAGCNNSGTTLLHHLLGSHPLVRALPREGQMLTSALPTPTQLGLSRLFTKRLDVFRWTEETDAGPALRVKYDWARYFDQGPGILLAKSPEDTLRTRWLQQNFSPSRFVVILRSPYAVSEGTRRRSGHSISDAAQHWLTTNEMLLNDLPHLQRHLLIRYEDFCEDPVQHLGRLQEFLDLEEPFSPAVVESCDVHNIDGRASGVRDFNAKSIARLSRQELDEINRIAAPLMERLGYDLL